MKPFQLRNLKRGDKVVIHLGYGDTAHFIVTKVDRGEHPYIRVAGSKARVTPEQVVCQLVPLRLVS